MFGLIDNNIRGWNVEPWDKVLQIQNGKSHKNVQADDGEYPVYGSGGLMTRATDFLCPANTIIIGRKGTINTPILVREPFWNVDTAFGLVPNKSRLNYMYLFWFCNQYDFEQHNKAAVLPSLTKNDLLKIEMQIPPLELQEQFASFVKQSDKSKLLIEKLLEGGLFNV